MVVGCSRRDAYLLVRRSGVREKERTHGCVTRVRVREVKEEEEEEEELDQF